VISDQYVTIKTMKVCIYSRVSTGQRDTTNQSVVLSEWAKQHGFEVVTLFGEKKREIPFTKAVYEYTSDSNPNIRKAHAIEVHKAQSARKYSS